MAYSYDFAGRMKTMTNWSTFSASSAGTGARVTTWNYNTNRGWLHSKDYPDASTGNPGTIERSPYKRLFFRPREKQ